MQKAPLARGYTYAVADCTFILPKGVFLSAVSTKVSFGTTHPASGFRYTKPPRPALPGSGGLVSKLHQEQHPRPGVDGYGFRILRGPHPGTGRLGDISLPLTGRSINGSRLHPHRQAGGVQPAVVYPVVGHHGPGRSIAFPGVTVGEDEILGAGGDGHPDAVAFPEAVGQLGGADLQADDLAFLQSRCGNGR